MYGTIARFKAKPGTEGKMEEQLRVFEDAKVKGAVMSAIYRMDNDPNEYYIAVVFDSKESYLANAGSPEQDARYRSLMQMMAGEPEWHDGEIIYSKSFGS